MKPFLVTKSFVKDLNALFVKRFRWIEHAHHVQIMKLQVPPKLNVKDPNVERIRCYRVMESALHVLHLLGFTRMVKWNSALSLLIANLMKRYQWRVTVKCVLCSLIQNVILKNASLQCVISVR